MIRRQWARRCRPPRQSARIARVWTQRAPHSLNRSKSSWSRVTRKKWKSSKTSRSSPTRPNFTIITTTWATRNGPTRTHATNVCIGEWLKPDVILTCKFRFETKDDALTHLRVAHPGSENQHCLRVEQPISKPNEKPFTYKLFYCAFCWKEFTWRANLVRHINIHTHEKSFPCSMCKKTFR